MAALPAFALSYLGESSSFLVVGTFPSAVPSSIALTADLGLASTTFAISSRSSRVSGTIDVDLGRLDPLSTSSSGTVDSILGGVFLIFSVPLHLKFGGEQAVHVLQGNVILGATTRGHVLRIRDGQDEDALEAFVTHDMSTS